MKLIYILSFDLDIIGGPNLVSREKARVMKKILGEENVEIWYPKTEGGKLNKYKNLALFDYQCSRKLMKLDNSNDDYRVIFRVTMFPYSLAALKKKKIKAVYEIHAEFEEEINLMTKKGIDKFLLQQMVRYDKRNLKGVDAMIFNHPHLMQKYAKMYPQKSIYTYNAVNAEKYSPQDQQQARKELNISADAKVAIILGAVTRWRGVDLLVNAFNTEIITKEENLYLYIVGATDTDYVRQLKEVAKANKNIIFVNKVAPEIASKYTHAADIALMPVNDIRSSPGSPIKLYEYAACGKPILTQKDVVGYSDEVLNYGLGKITDFTNPEIAAKDIIAFMKEDLGAYRKNNYQQVVNHLTWEHRISKWIELVEKL